LDPAGGSLRRGDAIRSLVLALALSSSALFANAQTSTPAASAEWRTKIEQLFAQQRWEELAQDLAPVSHRDADLDYYYGSALAQLGRWAEAREVFLAGFRQQPGDKRFAVELAGVAFKQKRYPEAAAWLHQGLRVDPRDAYANDFLGAVYFLEGNLEAALKYWNRVCRPEIESVQAEHPLRIRPALLDGALAFAPASPLGLPQLRTSQVRIDGLEIFPVARFQLAARDDGKFDLILNFQERNGWGVNKAEALLSTMSGVAYQTLYPAYFNLDRSAINITSLVRWDSEKRRLGAELVIPVHEHPKWRYRLGFDLRNENWAIRDSFTGPAPLLGALNLRREMATAEITSFNSGRWDWSAGLEFSHRDYRNVVPGSTLTPQLLLAGSQLKQVLTIRYDLWRVPEHRFTVTTSGSSQLARIWSQPAEAFAKLQGSLVAHWLPKSEGDAYETWFQLRGGNTWGQPPFDELYMVGMERDNDLWMRAHVGTRDGRKGSAPLGLRYVLTNSEMDRNIYGNGLVTVRLAPFLDSGKITDPSGNLGSSRWLWDTGAQAKLRLLGVGLTFIYGKDLLTGHNAYYFTAGR
jgi:tetratricopeptide (TPR) repeat protein